MTDAKHTPGPWFISRKYVVGPRDESDSQGFGMIVGVADVYGDNRNQDARLIAAAPDMLAALKEIAETPGTTESEGAWWRAKTAQAAIAKAEASL